MQTIARSTPIIFYPKTTDIPHIQLNYKTDIDNEILAATEKPNVLLAPVSKLALCNSVPDIIKVVHYLKQSTKIRQIFMWCSTKTIQDDKIIPFLQYLADIEVVLRTESHLQILTKRNTGSISRKVSENNSELSSISNSFICFEFFLKEYQYTIGSNFEIAVREKSKTIVEKQNTSPAIDPESFATFKITAADSEQKSRDALKLPYER